MYVLVAMMSLPPLKSGAPVGKPYDVHVWALCTTFNSLLDISTAISQFPSVGAGGSATPNVYEWDLRNMDGKPDVIFEGNDGDEIGIGSLALDPQR